MRLFIIIFLFLTNLSFAVEVSCNFEEVYGNGDTQQGILLLKNQNLRYEYYDKELYTIIARDENFFLIHRAHKNNVQKITENTILLETFIDISSEYPNIKRISVNSDAVNVSINLMNCNFSNIDRKYFKVFNFKEIDN